MRVQDYRDMTAQMFRLVDDWSACVDEAERSAWRVRASGFRNEFQQAECPRATDRDQEMHALALQKLNAVYQLAIPAVIVLGSAPSSSGRTRAQKYNASASRAVRLSRAARSAKRRGYF